MIRLFLFIFILCVADFVGIAKIGIDSFGDSLQCSQSKSSSEYTLDEHPAFLARILENSSSGSNFIPDFRKTLFLERSDSNVLKLISGYSPPINLFYFIRKDNVFISVLRL